MSFRDKVLKGVVWSAVRGWGTRIFSFATFTVLSRLLEPEAFGLVALAAAFIAFVHLFQDQGFGDALVQRAEVEPEHLDTAFWTSLLMGLLLMSVSIVAADPIAAFFGEPQLAAIIRWMSLGFVLAGLRSTQQALLRRDLHFRALTTRALTETAAGAIAGIAAAALGLGVWSLVIQTLVTGVVGTAVLWRVSNWRPGRRVSRQHFNDLFGFGINMVGANVLNFFNRRFDDLLIGYFLGPTALGYYAVAYRLLLIMTDLFTGVTTSVAMPAFARLQNDPVRLRRAFFLATELTSLVAFPAFFGVMVLAPELIPLLYGAKWAPSVPVMQILALIGILHSVLYFHATLVIACGKSAWRLRISFMNATANVTGFLLAVRWGIVAVAAAYVLRGYLLCPVEVWAVRKLIDFDLRSYLNQFIAPLLGSLAMVVTVLMLREIVGDVVAPELQLLIYLIGSGSVYLASVLLAAPSLRRQLPGLIRSAVLLRRPG